MPPRKTAAQPRLRKPADLSPDAAKLWDHISKLAAAGDLIKPIDSAALDVMCETYARYCEARRKRVSHGMLSKNSQGVVAAPWVGIEERASAQFRGWCAEFGLTPLARGALDFPDLEGAVVAVSTLEQLRQARRNRGAA